MQKVGGQRIGAETTALPARQLLRQLERLVAADEAPDRKALQQEVLNCDDVNALLAQPRKRKPPPQGFDRPVLSAVERLRG